MSIKSKAAIVLEKGGPIHVETIDVEPPREGEVLIEVKAAGLCHSDLHAAEGKITFNAGFPGLLGHEAAGVVVDVGPNVSRVQVGDHVVPFIPDCGECELCRSGKTNNCVASFTDAGADSRYSFEGRSLHPLLGLGLFSQYAVVHERALVPVRKDAAFEDLFYFGCGATTGIGAALYRADVQPGSTAIVFGLGGIGINVVQGCRAAGATTIIGVDINSEREAIARQVGATHFVNPRTVEGDLVAHLNELTGGGADYTFEAVGDVTLMQQAFEASHYAYGVCTVIGMTSPEAVMSISPLSLVIGRRLQGASMGGAKGSKNIPELVDLMMDGKLDMRPLIAGPLPIEQINEGFEMQKRGEGVRTYVTF